MSKLSRFDFKQAKQHIAEIIAIAETCPESLRQRCFELLFEQVFRTTPAATTDTGDSLAPDRPPVSTLTSEKQPQDPPGGIRKLPSNVLAFTRRQSVTPAELEKLFLLDHEPLLPIYKINSTKIAQAQLHKVMMILLENGLLNNQLSAPYPELRDSIREDGLMDGNFNKMLKRNHTLFRGAITESSIHEDQTVELTGAGMERLAQIIKELAA